MVWDLLTFGGLLFWTVVAFVFLTLTIQVHNERVGWATTTLVLAIAGVLLLSNVPSLLKNTPPIYYLYAILLYLVGAALWALIKWRGFYLPGLFRRYNDLREAFLIRKQLDEMPADPAVLQEFNQDYKVISLDINHNRMVRNNKGRITSWMVFWPFSLLETFVGDFLANVFDRIYRGISGVLQKMSDSMASKYSELN